VVVLGLVVAGAASGLLLLRPGSEAPGASPSPTATPEPDPGATVAPSPGLERFYTQQLDWAECGDNQCATLEVPLDYGHPAGESIRLALLKRPASKPDQWLGSMVVNPGGPGARGTSYAGSAASAFRPQLTDRFDVVGFDPRGTGDSSPVDCLDDAQLDAYVAGEPDPDTLAEVRAYMRQVRRFGRGCVGRSPDLVSHITTVEAARDMDVLRAALGEDTLTYFGASYGTKLGATYADLFPERVGRLVLDGAVALDLSPRDLALQQAAGFQTALESYVQDCVDGDDPCFLGDSVDAGLQRVSDFLTDVETHPLPTSGGRELAVGNAFYGIVTPLYNRDYWFLLSQGLQTAFDGDGTLLMALSDAYTSRDPAGAGYLDNSIEANLAINCLDQPWSIPAVQVPSELDDFEAASPVFGRAFAWSMTGCRGFTARSTEPARAVRAEGAAPILVIGTTRDPATPVEWARSLAAQLDSGVLVTRDGDGHTAYNAGNSCVDRAVEAYLRDGVVPEDGLAC
jgi:pimeloyl-ACP methyl ester carboxylesterase